MFTTYRVSPGDTYALIARKLYGDEADAVLLRTANPGHAEPLTPGTTLEVPESPAAGSLLQQQAPADYPDEVAVLIEGARWRFWSEVTWRRAIDTPDTFNLVVPFDASAIDIKETFTPFSYKRIEITVGGEPQFTGYMVNVVPTLAPDSKSLAVSGYSLPGVMGDCMAPASSYPLEFKNINLEKIAGRLARPFGIKVQFDADPGPAFTKAALDIGQPPLALLTKLAQQRGLIIGTTERGALLFTTSADVSSSRIKLVQGIPPLVSLTPNFNPQQYYSSITGRRPTKVGRPGGQYTVKNTRLQGVIRPFTFSVDDAEGGTVKTAVEAKAGRMFGNMATYSAEVATWRDAYDELLAPNTAIDATGADAMIYNGYRFLARSVEYRRTAESKSAQLDLVMPGSFSGQIPEGLPWDL